MKTYKVAVIGALGHVGRAMVSLFAGKEDYKVVRYDLAVGTKKKVNQCDLGIICVPTPSTKTGACDTSIVEKTVAWLKTPLILLKSTVAPGTTESLKKKYKKRLVMSPEYYGQSRYFQPKEWQAAEWPYIIVGGSNKDCDAVLDILAPVLGPTKSYFLTDATTAEIVKYWENIAGAMKVTLANEMYEICQRFGVSYHEARELWAQDPRVNRNHTAVFVKNRGFAGKCFPKDLSALIAASEKAGYNPQFLKEIQKANVRFRKLNS